MIGRRTTRVIASMAITFAMAVAAAAPQAPAGAATPTPTSGTPPSTPSPSPVTSFPPPTPVPPYGSPSPYPTALHTPAVSATLPPVTSAAFILEDLGTGEVLASGAPDERRPIASLTKIMTALLVLERARPGDIVTVTERATGFPFIASQLGLQAGERISVQELLYALLLQSANDAAVALAVHVGGSVEGFVRMMNERARRMGLRNTSFASPNGLADSGYSTVRDLAALTRDAYGDPAFARIVATKFHDVPSAGAEARHIQNRNILLWLYPGTVGVKTGFTSAAGFCLVAAAERGGERLLAVVLGEPEQAWDDGAALLNYGFTAFEPRRLIERGERVGAVRAGDRSVVAVTGASLTALIPVRATAVIRRTLRLEATLDTDIEPGDPLGDMVFRQGSRLLGTVPLVVAPRPKVARPDASTMARAAELVAHALGGVLRLLTP